MTLRLVGISRGELEGLLTWLDSRGKGMLVVDEMLA